MQTTDWSGVYASQDVYHCVSQYTSVLINAMEQSIPKLTSNRSSLPIWYSKELQINLMRKKRAHKRYISRRRFADYKVFSDLRASAKRLLKCDRCCYFKKIAGEVNSNPKAAFMLAKIAATHA